MEERALLAAAILTLAGTFSKDAEIRADSPSTNYGDSSRLMASGSPDRAILFQWNLNAIPTGSTVVSARMTLNVTNVSSQTYELYELRRGWSESEVTFNNTSGSFTWGVPGAQGPYDRNDTVLGTVTASSTGALTIELNAAGIAVVQGWVNNPGTNRGFILMDYGASSDGLQFRSKEDSIVQARPTFEVSYLDAASNTAPNVNAGANLSIGLSQTANLDGTVTDDGLPNPPGAVTTTWSKVSGPGTVTFGQKSAIDTTATFSAAGTYVLRLTANDGALASSDDVTVTVTTTPTQQSALWISTTSLMALPTSGEAWNKLNQAAQSSAGTPDLSNQNDNSDVITLAKALVGVRTNNQSMINEARANIMAAINTENGGETLALGRNLVSYVIAASIVGLPAADDAAFKTWLAAVRNETLSGRTLISTHEDRPNNWGTHAGASRAAAAVYLNDQTELARVAKVFKGWLGDRSSYAGFSYGDLSWQANPSAPVGINPKGATKEGHSIDGALPEEMRRGGTFQWPPNKTNYPWEALQGAFVQAEILYRAGYDVYNWEDKALLRAVQFLYDIGWPAVGDDEWIIWIVNARYGTNFQAFKDASPGKNMGWTAWTHQNGGNLVVDPAQSSLATDPPAEQFVLTDEKLAPIVQQAKQAILAVAGPHAASLLSEVTFEIVDLPDNVLGRVVGTTVYLDRDAAGLGWFIDSTPDDNREFRRSSSGEEWIAHKRGPAARLVDLQTAVLHELGHVVGLDHSAEHDAMFDTLSLGVRRTLESAFPDTSLHVPLGARTSHDEFFESLGRRGAWQLDEV